MRNKLIVRVRFPLTEANIRKTEPEVELIDTAAGSTWEVMTEPRWNPDHLLSMAGGPTRAKVEPVWKRLLPSMLS